MEIKRRALVGAFGLAALLDRPTVVAATGSPSSGSTFDLATPAANVLAMAKITATLDPGGFKHGWYSGVLMGVVPGSTVQELVGVIGMSTQRLRAAPELGGYQLLQKECGFFTDLTTGEVLDRWRNPYIDETVEPFHIANPAVNRWILPSVKEERFYDRVDGKEPPSRP